MKDPTVLILGGALFLTDLNTSEMSPFLFIVPIVILLFIVVDVALFFVLRKKKPADESLENKEENAILSQPIDGGASIETTPPTESSQFTQATPIMEESLYVDKIEENMTLDDLLTDTEPK